MSFTLLQASNPGNFDNDCDYAWLRGTNPEVVYHHVSDVGIFFHHCLATKVLLGAGDHKLHVHRYSLKVESSLVPIYTCRPLPSFLYAGSGLGMRLWRGGDGEGN